MSLKALLSVDFVLAGKVGVVIQITKPALITGIPTATVQPTPHIPSGYDAR